jgi:hypothetical protein
MLSLTLSIQHLEARIMEAQELETYPNGLSVSRCSEFNGLAVESEYTEFFSTPNDATTNP